MRSNLSVLLYIITICTAATLLYKAKNNLLNSKELTITKDSSSVQMEIVKRKKIYDSLLKVLSKDSFITKDQNLIHIIDSLANSFVKDISLPTQKIMHNQIIEEDEASVDYNLLLGLAEMINNTIKYEFDGFLGCKNILNQCHIENKTFNKSTFTILDDIMFNRKYKMCHFKKNTDFQLTNFHQCVTFELDTFQGRFSSFQVRFFDNTLFINNNFRKELTFIMCEFSKNVSFIFSTFNKRCDFSGTSFGNNADFSYLTLGDSASFHFTNTIFPDTLNFSYNSNIKTEIDLIDANFIDPHYYNKKNDHYFKPHYISLYKSDISKFHLDYSHFRIIVDSTVSLDRNSSTKIPVDESESMYEALLSNFKSRGQMESYKLLDIEYQEYKWKHSNLPLLVVFPKYWWNFGYSKGNIFIWTAGFLVLFTIISYNCLGYLNKVYKLEKIGDIDALFNSSHSPQKKLKKLWFSFVYTSAIFFRLTLKVEAIEYEKVKGTLYIFVVYSIGILCLAYMANYVIQK